jgi:predicted MFS family arabinose efflux permease
MSMASFRDNRLFALLVGNPDFGIYSAGSAVSLIGTWMQRIAIGWLTWELTRSGLWLGVVAFSDFIPVILIGPIAGAAADRWDRLRVMKTSQALSLAQAAILFALTASGHINVGLLIALTIFQGIVVAFNQPARLAFVPSLVPADDLTSALAIHSIIFNLARFIGPMFAGLLIVRSGVEGAFAANALSYLAALAALGRIHTVPGTTDSAKRRSFAADLREGIRYTATHPTIASLLVLLVAVGIGSRPLNDLLPGFAAEIFHSGAGGLSILVSAIGVGAVLGGLWLGHRTHSSGLIYVALGCSCGAALAALAAIATGSMWVAVPSVMVFGFCTSSAGTAMQTLIQLKSERRMRGRVMSIYSIIFRGAPSLGALIAGAASTHVGLRWPIVCGAMLVVGVCILTYWSCERIEAETLVEELETTS